MKRSLAVLLLAGTLFYHARSYAQSQGYTLDVVSWNIEFFGAPYNSGPSDKDLQRENVKKIMRYFDADIYGLTEVVDTMHLRRLRDSLGSNFEYAISPYSTSGNIGTNGWRQAQKLAFLYKKDIFTNVTTKGMMLNSPTASFNWANGRLPFLMTADATVNGITKKLNFILIHGKAGSTNEDYDRRLEGADELKDTLDTYFGTSNTLIIGDFNDALNRTISPGSGPVSSYQPIIMDSTDADHYKSITLPLALAGQTTMINYPNVIDNHVISNEVTPFYILNSAKIRTDVTVVVPNYVTAHNTSDHYPVFSQYSLSGNITSIPVVTPSEFGIRLFPVPTSGRIFLRATKTLRNLSGRILDLTGKTVSGFELNVLNEGITAEPTILSLPAGTYFMELNSGTLRTTIKFIIQ